MLIHEVDCASGNLHSVMKGLVLRVEAWERRQQRRMNIQNALRKLTYKVSAQQPHEPGQTNQFDLVAFQLFHQLPVIDFAVEPFRREADYEESSLTGDFEASRFRAISDHYGNLSI